MGWKKVLTYLTGRASCITIFIFLTSITITLSSTSQDQDQQTYIIHVSKSHKPQIFTTHLHWYTSILSSLSFHPIHPTKILYTYENTVHGFAARLTPNQASELRGTLGVHAVAPELVRQICTTHSPEFLGLNDHISGLWTDSSYAEDIVIGMLDTGIWPESRSFSDDELSSVPSTWKGICQASSNFTGTSCNKKLIGARYFSAGYEAKHGPIDEILESKSPRDTEGHGTHTAPIAAGSSVKDAGFYKFANGEARGIATKARLSIYKVCWREGCFDSDILAGLDQAVNDGVDVISISVSLDEQLDYDFDSFAIGSFGAVQKGIVVTVAGGNSGPGESKVVNTAPWLLTVGAASTDRSFPADAILGDGTLYRGISLYSGSALDPSIQVPLVYAGDYKPYGRARALCVPDPGLDGIDDVKGKIVVCNVGGNSNPEKGSVVKLAGGVGMILAGTGKTGADNSANVDILPSTMVDPTDGDKIKNYIKSQDSPTATIVPRGTKIGPSPAAPQVASFSSRGPSKNTPEIIKPDIIAPGVNILAGWSGLVSPSKLSIDQRRVEFNFESGTSMACPHVSGVAAMLRKVYPKWSPAAIKSAIMTTAYTSDTLGGNIKDASTYGKATPYMYGSGHINPNEALYPGLIYDISIDDYINYLCSIYHDNRRVATIVEDRTVDCSVMSIANEPYDLNYPSFSVIFNSDSDTVKHLRVVTNVGKSVNPVYKVKVTSIEGVDVKVIPSELVFSENQSLHYEIKFTSLAGKSDGEPKFGSIEWSDGVHVVRSPIAYAWNSQFYSPI